MKKKKYVIRKTNIVSKDCDGNLKWEFTHKETYDTLKKAQFALAILFYANHFTKYAELINSPDGLDYFYDNIEQTKTYIDLQKEYEISE